MGMSEDFITLNKRELKLLKAYMGHHGWNDLLVTYPNEDSLYADDAQGRRRFRQSERSRHHAGARAERAHA